MKKMLFVFIILLFSCKSESQDPVETLFRKYSDIEGFTSITLSGDLLRIFNISVDNEDNDGDCRRWSAHVDKLKLLIQDNDDIKVENFYEKTVRNLERNGYEEFFRMHDTDQDMIMLVRCQGFVYKEFLVIGGGDDNILIQVKGKMSRSEALCFSDNLKRKGGVNIVASFR